MKCARCRGLMLPDIDGDHLCTACGEYVYTHYTAGLDRLVSALIKQARQQLGQAKGAETKRRRRAERAAA